MQVTRVNPTRANSIADQGAAGYDITAQYSGSGEEATNWACMWLFAGANNPKIVAVDVRKLVAKALKYTEVSLGNVTIGSTGYKDLSTYVPTAVKNATVKVMATISAWTNNTSSISFVLYPDGRLYALGTPNTNITNVWVRLWYI